MGRHLAAAVIGLLVTGSSVFADDQIIARAIRNALATTPSSLARLDQPHSSNGERKHFRERTRPRPLSALYGSSAFLQSYDAYVTLAALKRGASEVNPVLKPLSDEPAAFIAMKAGLTATSIFGAEQLWKNHRRATAVALMAATNAVMGVIAVHNTAVVRRIK